MKNEPPPQSGSTDSRRTFWNKAIASVMAAQKTAGRHVTVSEHKGMGTFINVADTSARRAGGGAVCPSPVTIQFSGIQFDCGCAKFTPFGASFIVEDEGNVNSFVTTTYLGIHAFPACGDCL